MPEYLHPGVYMEEKSFRGKPIQGVSTSTAGFVGACRKGVEGRATLVTSMGQFRRRFGETISPQLHDGDYLGHSVKAFFDNGGQRVYVVRVLAGDATASDGVLDQGVVLRLADGVTPRGPTSLIALNSLRGISVGSVVRAHIRTSSSEPFSMERPFTVQSYDASRNRITVAAADSLLDGETLDPQNTYFTVDGVTALNPGPAMVARHRGVDGDNISVHVRPTDLPPVAIRVADTTRSQPILGTITGTVAAIDTTVELSSAALRRLHVNDEIQIGDSDVRIINAIADAQLDYTTIASGNDYGAAGGGTISLVGRGGNPLPVPIELGIISAGTFDLSVAPGALQELACPHDIAAMLMAGDEILLEEGANADTVTIDGVQLAQDLAAGPHVTLDAQVGTEQIDPNVVLIATDDSHAAHVRLFATDTASFIDPLVAGAVQPVSISDGSTHEQASVLLVDSTTNSLVVAKAGAPDFSTVVTAANWTSLSALRVAEAATSTIGVASTSSFYSGAIVELDTGSIKRELIVDTIDSAARSVTFTSGVGADVDAAPDPVERSAYLRVLEIDVQVFESGTLKESFTRLSWNPNIAVDSYQRNYLQRINDAEIGSALVELSVPAITGAGLTNQPTSATGFPLSLMGGTNGSALSEIDLIGTDNGPGQRTGIQALSERDNISIVAVPGVVSENVQNALIAHCELNQYRIAVLDGPVNTPLVSDLQAHRNNYDTKYGAMYAPWLKTLDLSNGNTILVPPCGHVAGIYARSDNTVGVHKAPANEVVRNINDVEFPFTAGEQDVLNPIGVNLIRDLTPRAIRVWGARTMSSDQEWKYVNVRRLFIFLEHSIDLGTQWVVFEPNGESLWARVTETVTSFLNGVWKSGALMGTSPEEAFFVTCDRSTMTQDDIDNGRLICEIGIAPVNPAEFVIFRIGQFTANN